MLALKLETKDHQTDFSWIHVRVYESLDKLLIDYQKTKHAQRWKKYYELLLPTNTQKENEKKTA